MVFFSKPTAGPDTFGGVWPTNVDAKLVNRAGATITKGQVVQLAFQAAGAQATEVATNDDNSYVPGFSNDTIWNTVVDPQSNAYAAGIAGLFNGAVFAVALETVADNKAGNFRLFGIVDAYVIESSGSDGAFPGQILSVTSTNSFDCHVATNRVVVGFYIQSSDASIGTTAAIKRVFLTNGMFLAKNATTTAQT